MKTITEIKVVQTMDQANIEEYNRLTQERREEIQEIWKDEFTELILDTVGKAEVTVKTSVKE